MLKNVVLGLLAVVTMAAPAGADLHYTMHTEARQIATTEPVNPMSGMGADMLTPPKSIVCNSFMPGFEIESIVTSIKEEPAPAGALEIPADYKEASAPASLGRPGQSR